MLAQPALLAIGAGALAGAVTGTTLVVTGILPDRADPQLTVLSCYDNGKVIGHLDAGQSMLVTARSADGIWLEVYIGVPGAERGWAPRAGLRFDGSIDGLPVAACTGSIPPTSGGPPATPATSALPSTEATLAPSAQPSTAPTIVATAAATLGPSASPSPTPKPTKTPKPSPTATPLPPPPTSPPTPTPGPTTDVFVPSVSAPYVVSPGAGTAGNYYIGHLPCSPPTATVRVNASDPSGLNYVRLWYARPQGGGSSFLTMSAVGGGVYEAVIAPDGSWLDGEIGLWGVAQDTHGNTSGFVPFGNPSSTGDPSLIWSSFCIT